MKKLFLSLIMFLTVSFAFADVTITKANSKSCIKKFLQNGSYVEFNMHGGLISIVQKSGVMGFNVTDTSFSVISWAAANKGELPFAQFDFVLDNENNIIITQKIN